MTSHETALAAALLQYENAYPDKWTTNSEVHRHKMEAAISGYIAALPADDLVERLTRCIVTASNDDYSEAMTDKRTRHIERLEAMSEAADALTASRSDVERLRGELDRAEQSNANLFNIIADIREKSGLGSKPMLGELAAAIGAEVERLTALAKVKP